MLQERFYIPFKQALFLSFADVMCFFISVYLLVGVFEKCQNILFLLFKRREKQNFHGFGIPSYFSFPKLSFIEYHTIISEVCFNNREFHYLIWCVIQDFLSTFSAHHLHNLAYLFIVLGFTLGFILGLTQSFGVHIIVLPFYSINNWKM